MKTREGLINDLAWELQLNRSSDIIIVYTTLIAMYLELSAVPWLPVPTRTHSPTLTLLPFYSAYTKIA